jgi:GT2 family glycosyltransferase
MATKVLDLELEQAPSTITGLEGYQQALVLFRFHGRPVGQAYLPVINGRLNQTELQEAATFAPGWDYYRQRLYDYLDWDEIVAAGRQLAAERPLRQATVAVCTRDRPDDLARCLDAFMALPDDGQEFLVVDNCPSTDATQKIVAQYDGRVRYVREDRPGLNVARNRALREARHEIIAFNDDDAIPDPNWLRALLRNFQDPDVLCVTGLTMPVELETKAQEWFERYSPFGRGFQRRFFEGKPDMAPAAGRVGAGANMAVRRSLLEKVGPFDEVLDSGTPTRSGGDTEMFARILSARYHIIYDPAALTWHRHRRTWRELRRAVYGYGVGTYALWTRMLLVERRLGVVLAAGQHFLFHQLPMVWRAITRQGDHMPLDLALAELAGCLAGSRAYLISRRLQDQR